MTIYQNINRLTSYALLNSLITKEDVIYTKNRLLELFQLDGFENEEDAGALPEVKTEELEEILKEMLDWAGENKIFNDEGIVTRDLFDTKIMGQLVPPPSDVIDIFKTLYDWSLIVMSDIFNEVIDLVVPSLPMVYVKVHRPDPIGLRHSGPVVIGCRTVRVQNDRDGRRNPAYDQRSAAFGAVARR